MQTEPLTIIWTIIGIISALVAGWYQYQKWRQSSIQEKLSMVRNLVTVAEQVFSESGSGKERRAYVLSKLVKRYPKEEYEHLSELIEAAVYELHQQQAKGTGKPE